MTINKSGEINFNKLVTHQLSKEKAERVTTNAVFDVTTSLVRFNPLHRFRKLWDITLSFLLAYNLVVTPFTIGFGMSEGTGSAIFWLNRVVDIFFMGELNVVFFLAHITYWSSVIFPILLLHVVSITEMCLCVCVSFS